MPSWPAEKETKLLLTIIKATNPEIPRTTWDAVVATMGAGYTYESVRQKYQKMKKESEASDRKAAATPTSNPATNPTTNSTTAKAKTTKASNKRKAASPTVDDDEEFGQPTKARKLKSEKAKSEGDNAVKVKHEVPSSCENFFDEA